MKDVLDLASEAGVDLEELRDRLGKMSIEELVCFGRAASYMSSYRRVSLGHKRLKSQIQLKEARKEYRRRKRMASTQIL